MLNIPIFFLELATRGLGSAKLKFWIFTCKLMPVVHRTLPYIFEEHSLGNVLRGIATD